MTKLKKIITGLILVVLVMLATMVPENAEARHRDGRHGGSFHRPRHSRLFDRGGHGHGGHGLHGLLGGHGGAHLGNLIILDHLFR